MDPAGAHDGLDSLFPKFKGSLRFQPLILPGLFWKLDWKMLEAFFVGFSLEMDT